MTPLEALEKAIEIAGGKIGYLAKAINEKNPQTINNWKTRGVPAEKCIAIERTTGVTCEELRPDVDWAYLRTSKKTKRRQAA